jgi:DNA-nicking Smr family endonuclease
VARKKKPEPSVSGKEFQISPFKKLKGLAVSKSHLPPSPAEGKNTLRTTPVPAETDDAALFAQEMEMLRVEKRDADDATSMLPEQESPAPIPAQPATIPATDRELFLAALGSMDSVFRDEMPSQAEPSAAPRRMRQLRQGKLLPEAQLDLHGATRDEARQKVRFFLEDSVFQGRKTVLVITGRGKGSPGGPVLRADMEKYLRYEAKAWVVEWGRAPARYGGEGALVVFLRQTRKDGGAG